MNCIIPAANVKTKTFQALSKVGDELYIGFEPEKLSLITLNLSKTVCARFDFLDSFFSSYEVEGENVACKIHMKIIMPLFKGNLEKKLEFLKIEYRNDADFIVFKMKYKEYSIMMNHNLPLMDSETLSIGNTIDSGCNNLCAPSTFYSQLLSMFCLADDEMTFDITKTKLIARNYCVGAPYRPKAMRSQVNLNAGEFSLYSIQEETTMSFAIRPLRTVVHFADAFNLNIGFNFETGGMPLSMIMKYPTFTTSFLVATLNPNSDMQSTLTTTSIPKAILTQKQSTDRPNITIEDQQALENENWDDFDLETDRNKNDIPNETTAAVLNSESSSNKGSSSTSRKSSDKALSVTRKPSISKRRNSNSFSQLMNHAVSTLDRDIRKSNSNERLVGNSQHLEENNCDKYGKQKKNDKLFVFNLNEEANVENNEVMDDVIPQSPESPRRKKAKIVFGRCFEPTFHETMLGEVLAPNSDSDSDF